MSAVRSSSTLSGYNTFPPPPPRIFAQEQYQRPSSPLTRENLSRHSTMYSNKTPIDLTKDELMGRYQESIQIEYIKEQKRKSRRMMMHYHHHQKISPAPSLLDSSSLSPSPVSSLNSSSTNTSLGSQQKHLEYYYERQQKRESRYYKRKSAMMRETENVVIDAPPLPFPYHNDAVFIPLTEQQARSTTPRRLRHESFSALSSSGSSPAPSLHHRPSTRRRSTSPPVWWGGGIEARKEGFREQGDKTLMEESTASSTTTLPQLSTNRYSTSPHRISPVTTPQSSPSKTTVITHKEEQVPRIALLADQNDASSTLASTSTLMNSKKKKVFGSKMRRWCQKTWQRLIKQ